MENSKQSSYFPPKNKNTDKQKLIKIIAIVIIVVVLAVFGLNLLRGKGKTDEEKTKTITRTPTPTSTPTPKIERSDLRIQVLNGSGKEGAAGDFAAMLEGLGYEKAETDNADNFDYEDVTIQVKDTDKGEAIYDFLRQDLEGEDYVVNDIETLDEDSDFDAVIIIGLKEGEEKVLGEETESPEPTPEESQEPTPTPEEPTATPTESQSTQSGQTQ